MPKTKSQKKRISLKVIVGFVVIFIILGIILSWLFIHKNTSSKSVSLLFVEQAKSGSLVKDGSTWKLTLTHLSRRITYFTDRPERTVGEGEFGAFLMLWKEFGFTTNPPNAAISIDPVVNKDASSSVMLVMLTDPNYDSDTDIATFLVTPLKEPSKSMKSFASRSGELSELKFVEPTLFIDNASLTTYEDIGNNVIAMRYFMTGMPIQAHDFHVHWKGNILDRRSVTKEIQVDSKVD